MLCVGQIWASADDRGDMRSPGEIKQCTTDTPLLKAHKCAGEAIPTAASLGQRDLRTVCGLTTLSAGGQGDLRAVRVLVLLAGDDNGGGDDGHDQQGGRDHEGLSAPPWARAP